jgi:hypothetical protein
MADAVKGIVKGVDVMSEEGCPHFEEVSFQCEKLVAELTGGDEEIRYSGSRQVAISIYIYSY